MGEKQGRVAKTTALSKGTVGKTSSLTGRTKWPRRRNARYSYKHRARSVKGHNISRKPPERRFRAKIKPSPLDSHRGPSNNLRRRLEAQKQ